MFRSKLQQFMIGRYGSDQLSLTTMWAAIILWFLYFFLDWIILYFFSLVLMGLTLFRMFSRQIEKRRRENNRFIVMAAPLKRYISHLRDREHRYFRCPNCKKQMRVPRGKGRIQVNCRDCGITFEEKS